MTSDAPYSIVYSNSRLLMEKSLEWAHKFHLPFRASITDRDRNVYNMNCTLTKYTKEGLEVQSIELLSLANVCRSECLLYLDSVPPQASSNAGTVSGKNGVFVCHTFINAQSSSEDGKTSLSLSSVGRIEFRELRRFPRAASSSNLLLATIWRCSEKLPIKATDLSMPDFTFRAGHESSMEVMDISAGGMRLRTGCEFGSEMPVAKGSTLLCMFVLAKDSGNVNVMVASRVISCTPISGAQVEIRLQFTFKMQGIDPEKRWLWKRLGQEGLVALRQWSMPETHIK